MIRVIAGLALSCVVAGMLCAQPAPTPAPKDPRNDALMREARADTVLRAMMDEILRSRQLTLMVGAPLYYTSFLFAKGDSYLVSASHGALLNKVENQLRVPSVKARVGSYESDDTNFVASGFYQGTRFSADRFPLDDNYQAMRRNWWLLTDVAYKSAAQSLSLKKTSMQNMQAAARIPDFTRAEPTVLLLKETAPSFDKAQWERRVRALSARFGREPDILESQVQFGYSRGTEYFVNSEGSVVRRPFGIGFLRVLASALSTENTTLWDSLEYLADAEGNFPSEVAMQADIDAMMDRLMANARAPIGENYRGPVLFEGKAAAQLVAQLIGRQVWVPRKPVMIPNRPLPWPRLELEGRLGMTVISEKLTVRDDPTLTAFGEQPLIGHTRIDLEAVKPEPLVLIRDGKLESLLRTRTPSNPDEVSNGRARIPGVFGANRGAPTNLIVESTETVPEASMKQKLMEMTTAAGRPYGLLVRKLDFPTAGPAATLAKVFSSATGAGKVRVSLPLAVYRVYPDGREEAVRNLNFRDLELRALRDLAAAGDQLHVFQYLENGGLFAQMGAGSYVAECSIISPSLLLEEVELEPVTLDLPTQPLVDPPALSASN